MEQRIKNISLGSLPFLFILLIWLSFLYLNVFPKWLISPPTSVALTFWKLLLDGTILKLVALSVLNLLPAFLLSLILAISIGTLIGLSTTFKKILHPFLSAIYPIPSLVWLPFIILFLGFTRQSIWFVIFISSFMKMIYNVIGGVQNVNQNWVLAARNLGLNRFKIITKVILPGALPQIITGVRLGFGSAWRSLIGAEMLVITIGGLGKFIWMAQWVFDFDKVIVGTITIALIGLLVEELIFKRIEKLTLIRWGLVHEPNK